MYLKLPLCSQTVSVLPVNVMTFPHIIVPERQTRGSVAVELITAAMTMTGRLTSRHNPNGGQLPSQRFYTICEAHTSSALPEVARGGPRPVEDRPTLPQELCTARAVHVPSSRSPRCPPSSSPARCIFWR